MLYSGFIGCALWIGWLIGRHSRAGRMGFAAVPHGYALGIAGVILFGAGGIGDALWHTIFGIETGLEALLSPTHLMLFAGGQLMG